MNSFELHTLERESNEAAMGGENAAGFALRAYSLIEELDSEINRLKEAEADLLRQVEDLEKALID